MSKDGKNYENISSTDSSSNGLNSDSTTYKFPNRHFYSSIVFKDLIYVVGGMDDSQVYNDVWRSSNGVEWNQINSKTQFQPRILPKMFVFNDYM